jgi:hypothetical protein
MNIDKSQIIDFLRNQGDDQKAEQADRELPDQVDTDSTEHQSLLERLGIDPSALIQRFLGGRGIPGF